MAAHNHFGDQSMPPTAQKIDQLQVTRDTLTSRGGLTFLVKYVVALHWKRRFWDCPSIYCTGIVEA